MKLQTINAALVWFVFVTSLSPLLKLAIALHMTFTNIKCTSLNKSCVEFAECRMRAVKRDVNEISVRAKLLQPPLVQSTVQLKFMKKSNGYRPYLGELNYDGCKFLESQSNPVVKYLYSFVLPYTNVNHSCPIDHDIIVKNYRINEGLLNRLTILPSGDYAFFGTWTVNNVKCARTEMYLTYKE